MTDDLARGVLAPLDDLTVDALRAFATGLGLAGGPVAALGLAVDYHADHRFSPLALLATRRALRLLALDGDLVVRLSDSASPFWRAVSDALLVVAEEMFETATTEGGSA